MRRMKKMAKKNKVIKLYGNSLDNYLAASMVLSPFNYVYLHGKLEELNGFDQIYYGAGDIFELLNKETQVKVVLRDQSEHDAIAFVWDGWQGRDAITGGMKHVYRGLVCAIDDEEAIVDARIKFNRRDPFL